MSHTPLDAGVTDNIAAANLEQEKSTLPYARSVYIKGILSIPLAATLFGFIYAVYLINIAFTRGKEMRHRYEVNPNQYKQKDIDRVKTGVLCARIATIIIFVEVALFIILFQ